LQLLPLAATLGSTTQPLWGRARLQPVRTLHRIRYHGKVCWGTRVARHIRPHACTAQPASYHNPVGVDSEPVPRSTGV